MAIEQRHLEFFHSVAGQVDSLTEISGGLIHRVFKIQNSSGSYYMKIRDPEHSRVEGIRVLKRDVEYEFSALKYFATLLPTNYPQPVAFDPDLGLLIMREALSGSVTLKTWMNNCLRQDKAYMISQAAVELGRVVSRSHRQSANKLNGLKLNPHNNFSEILRFRYEYHKIRNLDDAVKLISSDKKVVLHGGLSAKNILISENKEIAFVDLETACLGNIVFDYCFCIAHLLIELLHDPKLLVSCYNNYRSSYQSNNKIASNCKTIYNLLLGTILYRLTNPNVPYPLKYSELERSRYTSRVRFVLSGNLATVEEALLEISQL